MYAVLGWILGHIVIIPFIFTLLTQVAIDGPEEWSLFVTFAYCLLGIFHYGLLLLFDIKIGTFFLTMSIIGGVTAGFVDPLITQFMGTALPTYMQSTSGSIVSGILVGGLQAIALRQHSAFWGLWIFAMASTGAILTISPILIYTCFWIGWIFLGILIGSITGFALYVLLRVPISDDNPNHFQWRNRIIIAVTLLGFLSIVINLGAFSTCGVIDIQQQRSGCIGILDGHKEQVWTVAFSPDNKMLASGGMDDVVYVWDLADQSIMHSLLYNQDTVISCVAFSPNGKLLASGSWDRTVRVWQVEDGLLIKTLSSNPSLGYVEEVAFSPDGKLLVVGSREGYILVWDTASWDLIATFYQHSSSINTLSFAANGQMLSSDDEGTLNLWDIENGISIRTWEMEDFQVIKSALSPNGQFIAAVREENAFSSTSTRWSYNIISSRWKCGDMVC